MTWPAITRTRRTLATSGDGAVEVIGPTRPRIVYANGLAAVGGGEVEPRSVIVIILSAVGS